MQHAAIDLGKFHSQTVILTEAGELKERRIRTERTRLEAVFGSRAPMRILMEASTDSEWVARCLEGLGHEVVVADPNYAPMYARRNRRVKTDRRDAQALLEACIHGTYRPAHRLSDAQRQARVVIGARDALVKSRTRLIALVESMLRREGHRVRNGAAGRFCERVAALELPAPLRQALEPLTKSLELLTEQIDQATRAVTTLAESTPETRLLMSVPGVGPVTAASFVATLDDPNRFRGAHQVEAYLGLVPSELSSGEKQHRGAITKLGNDRMRWLLVEVAWGILIRRHAATASLRAWAERIAQRRGKRVAVVALARKLAGILYAMWRDEAPFDPSLTSVRQRQAA